MPEASDLMMSKKQGAIKSANLRKKMKGTRSGPGQELPEPLIYLVTTVMSGILGIKCEGMVLG